MLILFSKVIFKILKENTFSEIRRNKNSRIGKAFRIGNYPCVYIHSSASLSIGDNVHLKNYCNIVLAERAKVILGKNVFMNNYCSVNAIEKIEIGDNTLFGEGVKLYDHNHEYDGQGVEHKKFRSSPITIGKNCWLGSNVTVLRGVTIGDNCIIGANCLIHRDVAAGSIIRLDQSLTIQAGNSF